MSLQKAAFLTELKRRNVYRAAAFYAATIWLLVQIATQVFPFFGIPDWTVRWIVVAAAIGFPFAMLFAWLYEWTPTGLKLGSTVDPSVSITHRTGRTLDRWIVAVLSVAVVLLLSDRFMLGRDGSVTAEKSIAVLPFANTSDDPGNEYFADGLSEELISTLSHLGGVRVIGRTSSFLFKGKTEDSKAIGEQLGVEYLLEGSVRKSSSRVRIAVALVKSADGAHVWSEIYDRALDDIFAVQAEIAGAVAGQLAVTLHGDGVYTAPTPAAPSTRDVNAYNALLQGSFYSMRRTAEGYRKAIDYYEEAVRLDPRYALAYARLSTALVQLATRYAGVGSQEGRDALAKARTAADTALALDPGVGEAHRGRAMILDQVEFDVPGAEQEYRRAVELSPQDSRATQSLANVTGNLGRLDEATELTRRAIALDPLRSESHFNLAILLIVLGRYDEAEAALGKAMELQPQAAQNYLWLAIVAILRGTPAIAVEVAERETDPFWRTFGLALAHFSNGAHAKADAYLQTLIDENSGDAGSQIASIYALRKDSDQVFRWLDHAWETRDPGVMELRINPFLLMYKDDPRFADFARKIGVMPVD